MAGDCSGEDAAASSSPTRRTPLLLGAVALDRVGAGLAKVAQELAALVLDAAWRVEPEPAVDLALERRQGAARLVGEAGSDLGDGGVELRRGDAPKREADRGGLDAGDQ